MSLRCGLCLAGSVLAAAGCGGGEVDPPDLPATVSAGGQLEIVADEYVFSPNRISIVGGRGQPVRQRIDLANRGELAHNIEVLDGDRLLERLRSFPSGQTRSLSVRLPPGRYRLVCTVADHDEKGMRGTLEVLDRG
jgi:plastocyanin